MKDCIIIGAGPAGLAAALYLARYEKEVLILTTDLGGQAFNAGVIENYPAVDEINGSELISKMVEQVKKYKSVEIKYPVKVKKVAKADNFKVEDEAGEIYESKTVLIASGKHHRHLGIEGEEALVGKGLSYCATCDGPFAKGKRAVVIGGGNSAASSALILAKIAEQVTILNLGENLMAEQIRIDAIISSENITIINNAKTTGLEHPTGLVSGVAYVDKEGSEQKIDAQMVFVEIGYEPNSDIFTDVVDLNSQKEIIVGKDNSTKTDGLYACGDITDIVHKQVIIASGDGAKAAMSVNLYLEKK